MIAGHIVKNRLFDEIALDDTAMMSRMVTADDLALIAGLVGTSGAKDMNGAHKANGSIPKGAEAMWCEALVAEILHTQFPGPGTTLIAQSVHLDGDISLGGTVTAQLRVKERRRETQTVAFDWVCADEQGGRIASGISEVVAPTQKIETSFLAAPQIRIRRHEKYERLIARCRELPPIATAVAYPCDQSSLAAVVDAANNKIIRPILVGPPEPLRAAAKAVGLDLDGVDVVHVPDGPVSAETAAAKAVELVRLGQAELLMKGSLHTDALMAAVVKKEGGLRTGRRISHCFVLDVPTYHKPLIVTDAAINIAPTLEDKVDIVQNAIDLARVMGVDTPRVAVLSALETVNPKIQSTLDAAALCKMADRGQIKGGLLDGPLALDNAISKAAAKIKGIISEVAGDADILMVPDLEAGNMLAKNLTFLADADAAGIVLGARIPIILTSRADSLTARIASCAVGALYAHRTRAVPVGGRTNGA